MPIKAKDPTKKESAGSFITINYKYFTSLSRDRRIDPTVAKQ